MSETVAHLLPSPPEQVFELGKLVGFVVDVDDNIHLQEIEELQRVFNLEEISTNRYWTFQFRVYPYLVADIRGNSLFIAYEMGLSDVEESKIERALEGYEDFHWGVKPKKILDVEIPDPVGYGDVIGDIKAIMYQTKKAGDKKSMIYVHPFTSNPIPTLVSDPDFRNYFISTGGFSVRPEGIVD